MTVFFKEMKKGAKGLFVWTGAISFMLLICIIIYPEMKGEMEGMNKLFSNMGAFSDAFGMDKLNFSTLIGYYGIECGNMLGMGGAFFASLLGISMLSKEEKDHTAEFLLTHPVKRVSVIFQKLIAVVTQVVFLNVVATLIGYVSIVAIGEEVPLKEFLLIHTGYFILQIEIALICFGVSAFISRGGLAIGIGISVFFYFANLISNITEKTDFLKYFTPFAYADPAEIVKKQAFDGPLIALGMGCAAVAVVIAFLKYSKKDIAI